MYVELQKWTDPTLVIIMMLIQHARLVLVLTEWDV